MKHLFVLPYYSEKEVDVYLEVADVWEKLTETSIPYSFLLSSRYDCKPSERLFDRFSKIAPCEVFQCKTKGSGIMKPDLGFEIEGPSSVFWDTMEYINQKEENDRGFVFWFESDIVPLKSNWINSLNDEWLKGDYALMGVMIDFFWLFKHRNTKLRRFFRIKPHINGGAAYSKNFVSYVSRNQVDLSRSWDYALSKHIVKGKIPYKKTKLIEFHYKANTLLQKINQETVLLHGVKDNSARKYALSQVTSA